MAARRLVIVMLVLLGLSTLAAAVVPGPERNTPTETGTIDSRPNAGSAASPPPSRAGLVERGLRISAAPETVTVRPGDELRLAVSGPYGDEITIPRFGLTQTMTPYAPARFDILIGEAGSVAIIAEGSGRVVGRIVSRPGGRPCLRVRRPARPERSRARGCSRRGTPAS